MGKALHLRWASSLLLIDSATQGSRPAAPLLFSTASTALTEAHIMAIIRLAEPLTGLTVKSLYAKRERYQSVTLSLKVYLLHM